MKKYILFSLMCCFCLANYSHAQIAQASVQVIAPPVKDMNLLSTWSTGSTPFNDIWGYVDPQEKEVAIIGSRSHYYFVDISNPTDPQMIDGFAGGNTTVWRDMKTYSQWAYGVCDNCSEGLSIFKMGDSPAADGVEFVRQDKSYFTAAHNIFIDELNGRLYIIGSNTQANGVIILDIKTNPEFPTLIAASNLLGGYMHDLYVRNHIGYANSANNGLYVYDFSNPSNFQTLGSMTSYPQQGYNHASWLNPAGDVLIMADETHNTSLKAVDVSDLSDIEVTSLFRSELLAPQVTGSIAHNPFVRDNYAIVSYYHDGVQIFDISNPSNVIQTAWYDTFLGNTNYSGFSGCWGVYPYLPSGNILGSDGSGGLFVLEATDIDFIPIPPVSPPFGIYGEVPPCIEAGTPVELSVSTDGHTIQWFKDGVEIGFVESVTATNEGVYQAKVYKGPHSLTLETINITYGTAPNVGLNVPSEFSICEDEETELFVTDGADNYEWFLNGNLFASDVSTITTNQAGTYTVTVSNGGCSATSEMVQLEIDTYADSDLNISGEQLLCDEESIVIASSSNAESYQWFLDGNIIEGANSSELTTTDAGSYYLQLSNGNCVLNSQNVELTYNETPSAGLNTTGDVSLCEGEVFELIASTGADRYDWIDSNDDIIQSGSENTLIVVDGGGVRMVAYKANCQASSEQVNFTFTAFPESNITGNSLSTICEGEVNMLTTNVSAENYQWLFNGDPIDNANGSSLNASIAGEYALITSNGNCSTTSDNYTLEVVDAPNVSLLVFENINICEGETAQLIVSQGAESYTWSLNGNIILASDNVINVSDPGNYVVIASNGNCQAAPIEIIVTIEEYPNVDIFNSGDDNVICPGDEVYLVSNTNAENFVWLRDEEVVLTNDVNLYTTEPGTYVLESYNNQCVARSEPIIITAGEVPVVNLEGLGEDLNCAGECYVIKVDAVYESYQWYLDGFALNENDSEITVCQRGRLAVEVSSADGCTASSDIIAVDFTALPNAELDVAANQNICAGESIDMMAPEEADLYSWTLDGVVIASSRSINAKASGVYQLQVLNNGCTNASQEINISVEENPAIEFNFTNAITICEGDSFITNLDISYDSYQWYRNDALFSTDLNVELDQEGEYYLEATSNSCVGISSIFSVAVLPLPDASLIQSGEISICEGESSTLIITAQADNYTWYQNGTALSESTNELTINAAGDYYAEVKMNGCTAVSATVNLNVNVTPLSEIDGAEERELCNGSTEELICTIIADDYTWFLDGVQISQSINSTITASEAGTYTVMTSLGDCTTLSEGIEIIGVNLPSIEDLFEDFILCSMEEITVTAPAGQDQYTWVKDGQQIAFTENEFTIAEAGTYMLEIQQGSCSATSNSFTVNYLEPVIFDEFPTEFGLCAGEIATLTAPLDVDSYLWIKDGSVDVNSGDTYLTSEPGVYQVEVTKDGCVTLSPVVTIVQNVNPTASIVYTDNIVCEGDSLTLFADVSEDVESVSWFLDGVFLTSDTLDITILKSGTYAIEATNGTCTIVSEVANPTVYELPIVNVLSASEIICPGEMATLNFEFTINSNFAYILYLNGTSVPFSSISPLVVSDPGNYTLEVLDLNIGCSSTSEEIVVSVFEVTIPTIEVNDNILSSSTANSYQWYMDGTAITDATSATYEALETGAYQVETTDINGCIATSLATNVITSSVQSIPSLANFYLYPNPVTDLLSISIETDTRLDLHIIIYSQLGQILWSKSVAQNGKMVHQIPVKNFAEGVYFISVSSDKGGVQTLKFVK